MSNMLLLIVQLLIQFLNSIKSHKDCPDGICDEPLADAGALTSQLSQPNVGSLFNVFDIIKLVRCVPMDRCIAVVKRIGALFRDCDRCPDGDCSFLDLIGCLDLKEAVAIIQEVLAIIRDSQFCIDGDREITLGQAVS